MRLPTNKLRTKWVWARQLPPDALDLAQSELDRATASSGWNPKLVKLHRSLHMIDLCGASGSRDLHSIKVALLTDHPFLAQLNAMPHVPRVVKSLYRKEVRLAHERADEYWTIMRDWRAAEEAWDKYLKAASQLPATEGEPQ